MKDDVTHETHESYGMIEVCRVSGAGRLFGSPLSNHFGSIRIRIQAGERRHAAGEDRYSSRMGADRRDYIEVEMSAAQFAEAITTMNVVDGVPCTIRRLMGKRVADVPEHESSETARSENSYRERVKSFVAEIERHGETIDGLLVKDRLSKEDRKQIRDLAARVVQEVRDNAPFFVEQFTEATARVSAKAKAEIAAMMEHAVRMAGMDVIRERLLVTEERPALPEKGSD